jgi:hypothetical protein
MLSLAERVDHIISAYLPERKHDNQALLDKLEIVTRRNSFRYAGLVFDNAGPALAIRKTEKPVEDAVKICQHLKAESHQVNVRYTSTGTEVKLSDSGMTYRFVNPNSAKSAEDQLADALRGLLAAWNNQTDISIAARDARLALDSYDSMQWHPASYISPERN